ncbi:histidine kinase [Pseudonocardia sulfidoxydans NBRC 16205]|uniref:histidine kinase n=1 Tax=Pseudonocardia sulfidoxydans NBRC 16205 TaxID=1223511 RepID=A0A511DG80_9PSEU|nr:sensor histidine kinase [Pseudonocardia sulfidoxydans]GEL23796.1 histidine kinase [Pseudonocardia sulfidoxydans NBRC 16205]
MTRPAVDAAAAPTRFRRPRLRLGKGGGLPVDGRARADEGRRWPLARIFGAVAAVALVLSVIAAVVGAVSLYRLNSARADLLDKIGPAVRTGQLLATALVDQETGVRGFQLSGREESLAPYVSGSRAAQDALATLTSLRDGVPGLGAWLDRIEPGIDAWHTGYADPAIAAVREGRPVESVAADGGRSLFDPVRVGVDELQADLDTQRLAARERLDTAATFVSAVGIVVAVVALLFLVATGIVLRRAVLRPISLLTSQVRGVVSGSVTHRVDSSGPREIVMLGDDVEAMRAHIVRELDRARDTAERLDEQTRDLERSNRDLEQFAYVASHDLQEPLRKVASFCQLLQRRYGGKLDERGDQYIEFAVDGAQRMQRLINDLLAFSRVGRTTSGFTTLALRDVVSAAADQQETPRAEADGEIVVEELPSVPGDRQLLLQLFANLIGNAIKFRRPDAPPVVRIAAAPVGEPGEGWEISVSDNGIGIEPEYADKVFVIFQRLHGRDVYTGTGIGLALAKKIVEFHGGRIWVDTDPRPEPGTTIRFTLVPPRGSRGDDGAASTDDTEPATVVTGGEGTR